MARKERETAIYSERGHTLRVGQVTTGNGSMVYFAFHALKPPASATALYPRLRSCCASRALVASFCQLQ